MNSLFSLLVTIFWVSALFCSGEEEVAVHYSHITMVPSTSIIEIANAYKGDLKGDLLGSGFFEVYMASYYDYILSSLHDVEPLLDPEEKNLMWNLGVRDAAKITKSLNDENDCNELFRRLGFHEVSIKGILLVDEILLVENESNDSHKYVKLYADNIIRKKLEEIKLQEPGQDLDKEVKHANFKLSKVSIRGWISATSTYMYQVGAVSHGDCSNVMSVTKVIDHEYIDSLEDSVPE